MQIETKQELNTEKQPVKLSELFWSFAKIGVMTIGGGLTMLPLLERELIDNRHWVEEDELLDYYAIAQCTPGIIAVNVATFVGTKHRKTIGGIIATFGMVFPSVAIITIIATVLSQFAELPAVQNAFVGIRAGVCALMLNTVIKLVKKSVKDALTTCIFLGIFILMLFLDISPVVYVLTGAALGLLYKNLVPQKKAASASGEVPKADAPNETKSPKAGEKK